jgi:hypothetical protein
MMNNTSNLEEFDVSYYQPVTVYEPEEECKFHLNFFLIFIQIFIKFLKF